MLSSSEASSPTVKHHFVAGKALFYFRCPHLHLNFRSSPSTTECVGDMLARVSDSIWNRSQIANAQSHNQIWRVLDWRHKINKKSFHFTFLSRSISMMTMKRRRWHTATAICTSTGSLCGTTTIYYYVIDGNGRSWNALPNALSSFILQYESV